MRVLVVVLAALVVAGAVFIFLSVTAGRPFEPAGAQGVDAARLDAMEQELADMRQNVERLGAAVESLDADVEALASSVNGVYRKTAGKSTPPADQEPAPETPERGRDVPADVLVDEPGGLRQLVREEIKRAEEERKKRIEEERKAQVPEEWEREEFKELAWSVHSMGNKVGLTDKQKRQYHSIIKEHHERIRTLWKDLKEKNPGVEWKELSKLYQAESKELTNTTRKMVSDILDKEQRKKYDKECEESSWFK